MDPNALAQAMFFLGGSLAILVMAVAEKVNHPDEDQALFINHLYQIDSIIRLYFTQVVILFGAAICIKVWKHNEVNYMYIF